MRIAIIGTRGIPNNYGGFEQISEYLSVALSNYGHEVSVYCSHNHPYKQDIWKGVRLIKCYDPEYVLKTAGQFIYDFNCIMNARKEKFDVLLFMGYTSSSVWFPFFPKNTLIISNMDGLEWKRDKYSKPVQKFLKYAEKLAVRHSHFHIADSKMIKENLDARYNLSCSYIPYGAYHDLIPEEAILKTYGLEKEKYYMLMARMEPENNIDMILEGFIKSESVKKIVVVGNIANRYGKKMKEKYNSQKQIIFLGSVFDQPIVNSLRHYTALYFHGHSVGGTNPSLLEAMSGEALIAAHSNPFNQCILEEDAFYFNSSSDIAALIKGVNKKDYTAWICNNKQKIKAEFSWDKIAARYEAFICSSYEQFKQCPSEPVFETV